MPQPQLLILEADDATPGAFGRVGLRHALERAGLPATACRVVRLQDFLAGEQHPSAARGFAAWLIIGQETEALAVDEALEKLDDLNAPVALTRQCRGGQAISAPGEAVVGIDPRTPLDATAAVLVALARQALPQAALAAERRLLRRQHEGLSKEMSRLDDELRMAMRIQRGFLPDSLPTPAPLDVQVLWRPAGYVGGDLYDVCRLDEHHLGLFVIDAVGHGIPAALMSIFLKQVICQRELTPGDGRGYRILSPSETLSRLNQDLLDLDHGSTALATGVVGVLDTRTGELNIARGGHPFPMLLRNGEPAAAIEPEGPMLGVFACDDFEEERIHLRDGDRLLLYSDGFELAFPDNAREGTRPGRILVSDRYLEEFSFFAGTDAAEAMETFRLRLEEQSGSLHPPDDLTLLCLSVNGDWCDQPSLSQAA